MTTTTLDRPAVMADPGSMTGQADPDPEGPSGTLAARPSGPGTTCT
jgi:hypothetical protein